MAIPTPGQKLIPLGDWKRFLRVADWFERTMEHGKGVLSTIYGQAFIVKTPEGGIDARDGETIFSATCIKCIAAETETAGEKTLHETDEELIVYNFHTVAVHGDAFVKTALSPNGTRFAEIQSYPWHRAQLGEPLNAGSGATATLIGPGTTITVHDEFLKTGTSLDTAAVVGVEYDPWQEKWVTTEAKC